MSRRIEPFASGVLRLVRHDAGLSQVRLGEKVGVSARQIAHYEQGHHSPSPEILRKLAEALGTTPQVLAGVPVGEESLGDLRRFAGLDRVQAVRLLGRRLPGGPAGATQWKLQAVEAGRAVPAWRDPAVLKQVVAALAETYAVPAETVRRCWFRAFPDQADLLRPERRGPAASGSARSSRAEQAWRGLNARQRAYLVACFREDQQAEREARAAGGDSGPASGWRRVPFTVKADPAFTAYTPVQERLRQGGWHDAGAGATLHSLARRGLVEISEDQVEVFPVGCVARVLVEMTRAGRACARAGLREKPPRRPPGNLLSRWLWEALVKVAVAGPAGLPEDGLWGRAKFYLGTGYRPRGVLSRGYVDCVVAGEGSAELGGEFRWVVTMAGREHIVAYLQAYRDLYPDMEVDRLVEWTTRNSNT